MKLIKLECLRGTERFYVSLWTQKKAQAVKRCNAWLEGGGWAIRTPDEEIPE